MNPPFIFQQGYDTDPRFPKRIAYFCMEFGIDQPLKTYAGGLGFLAGSYLRSAFDLKMPVIGIGILWKYGYYDQGRKSDQTMNVSFGEKRYRFLEETSIRFTIKIARHDVWVTAYRLPPSVFGTAPVFFLSTDLPENDYLAQTISHKLYDANPETAIAASILLGYGGVRLLEILQVTPDIYHLNESHALPLAYHLYHTHKTIAEVRRRLVYTNHTPEEAGNRKTGLSLLEKMSYFSEVPMTEVNRISSIDNDMLDHTGTALKLAGIANGVSQLHTQYMQQRHAGQSECCVIRPVTNAQHSGYWQNAELYRLLNSGKLQELWTHKQALKRKLFEIVADQCGEIYDETLCTLVFAKRFTGYKRPDIFFHDKERLVKLLTHPKRPLQIIWAGKPYPMDYSGIGMFDSIVDFCKKHPRCSILTGYELGLSKILKAGADVWLNTPRLGHEASGTSGMSAAMNGALNLAIPDGWFPEFAKNHTNSFVISPAQHELPDDQQDDADAASLFTLLENEVLPLYYDFPDRWLDMMSHSMTDILPGFNSHRMIEDYYNQMYHEPYTRQVAHATVNGIPAGQSGNLDRGR